MIFDLFIAFSFLGGLFYVGIRKSETVQSQTSYLLADRKTGLLALTATLVMTEFNTATLISFSSLGYLVGTRALFLPAVFLIALLFYALTVAKKWKEFDGISVASFFSKRFGRDIGILTSIALLLAMAGFSAAYVKSLYLLFSPFFPSIHPWILSGILVACSLAMMVRGGLISIIKTDLLAFFATLLVFPLVFFFSWKTSLGLPREIVRGESILPLRFVISLIVLTMFTYILAPWYGQKIFSARCKKTAFLSVLFAALLVFALYALAVMSSWFFRKNGGGVSNPESSFPMAMLLTLPIGLRGLGYALLFAASATTLSGVWSAMCSLIVGDFLSFDEKEAPRYSMGLTLIFGVISYLLANILVDKVLDKLILANIPVAALSFALLGGFYWNGVSRFGVYLSMIVGWACGIGAYLYFGEGYTWYWAMWGIPLTFITGILGSILFPNKRYVNSSY